MIRCPSDRDRHRTMQHLIDQLNWNHAKNWRIHPEVKLSLPNILLFSPCEGGDHLYDVIYTALKAVSFKSNKSGKLYFRWKTWSVNSERSCDCHTNTLRVLRCDNERKLLLYRFVRCETNFDEAFDLQSQTFKRGISWWGKRTH